MVDKGAHLYSVASRCADDIAVADYLLHKYGGGSKVATPGQLVNWVIRMDPEDMDAKTRKLKGLYSEGYDDLAKSEIHSPFGRLSEHWQGDGAVAFSDRFSALRGYVIGENTYRGIVTYLHDQTTDMHTLATNTETFQGEVADLVVQYLKGLRKKYINALTAEGGGSDSEIMGTAADYGGVGAGLGAIGGPKGAAIGGAVGVILGAIMGFVESSEKSARRNLHIEKVGDSFGMTIKELTTKLDVMDRARYSDGPADPNDPEDGRSEYDRAEEDTGDPKRDSKLDRPWT